MALIQRGLYEQFAARHLAVKGPGALTNLEEGVMGTLPLDLMSDPMYWSIQGMRIFAKEITAGGVAGQLGSVGIFLEDQDEPTLARILGIHYSRATTAHILTIHRVARTAISCNPGAVGASPDTRIAETTPSQAMALNCTNAAVPGTMLAGVNTSDNPDVVTSSWLPMIVSPGQGIILSETNVNTELRATFTWVEVPAYRAEL